MATERNGPNAPDVDDLDGRVAALYGGPLAEFVARRDALARSLRAAGRRDEATEVKALKKPKALAWALDAGAHAEPRALAELTAAVGEVGEAQVSGGDVRAALSRLRAAETAVVAAAAVSAVDQGHPVDGTTVAAGLRAVVGDPDALAALEAGRLVDVPGTGGFGPAVSDPTPGPGSRAHRPRGATARRSSAAPGRDTTEADTSAVAAAARQAVADAEQAAAAAATDARATATAAEEAEAAAHEAEDDAVAARRRADAAAEAARQARLEAEQRAARQAEADRDLAAARDALRSIGT